MYFSTAVGFKGVVILYEPSELKSIKVMRSFLVYI